MSQAETYWNQFYSQNNLENQVNSTLSDGVFIKSSLHRLKKGMALDLGCGNGTNSILLAKNEFKVLGIDISEMALNLATKNSQINEVQPQIEFKKMDIDLFIFGLLQFDTIIMSNFKPHVTRVYDEIIRSLKHGGILIVESLLTEEINELMGPEDHYKNFYYKSNELIKQLSGSLRILFYNESIINGKHRVQLLAQKPTDKDIQKYNLFNMAGSQPTKDNEKSSQLKLAESLFKKKD